MNQKIKDKLIELGWTFSHVCGTCHGAKKHIFTRDKDKLTAYPSRDFYSFTDQGKTKTGKLSQL